MYFIIQGLFNIWTTLKLCQEMFAPVWSLSKVLTLRNLVLKSLQKIWSENSQKRRPRGSSIKHGEIWPAKFGQMCLPQIFQVYPPPPQYICLNFKLYFALRTEMEWFWNKVIWASID